MAQLKGRLTKDRYRCATIFLDHYSSLSYVHFQSSISGEDALDAKKAFEAYARSKGVRIQHYHADNGRFTDRKWIDHVQQEGQIISYCAAYAHFQNDKSEKRIRYLQEQAHKVLLRAIIRWVQALNVHL